MSYRDGRTEAGSADSRPLREIVGSLVADLRTIVRDEIRLALLELRAKLRKSRKGVVYLAAAAFLGFVAAECFVTACIVALAIVLPLWLSALIIAVLAALAAGGAFVIGRLALERVDPIPRQTLETLKDNLDWVKNRLI